MRSQACMLGAAVALGALLTASCQVPLETLVPRFALPTQAASATLEPAGEITNTTPITVSAQVPICRATASCAALNAEQIMLDCVKKVPYTNVLVPKGTTFEVV